MSEQVQLERACTHSSPPIHVGNAQQWGTPVGHPSGAPVPPSAVQTRTRCAGCAANRLQWARGLAWAAAAAARPHLRGTHASLAAICKACGYGVPLLTVLKTPVACAAAAAAAGA